MEPITVKEASIKEAEKVDACIPEFTSGYLQKFFKEKYNEKKHVILVADFEKNPAGYIIGYDRFEDNSIYCWCFGVKPEFRKKGVSTALIKKFEEWAVKNNFLRVKIKTENRFKEAIICYIKNNYRIISIDKKEKTENNEIWMEKKLG